MGTEKDKVLFYDRGDHLYVAEKLAEKVGNLWCYIPILGTTPYMKDDQMGEGLDGVERVDDFWKYVDKADYIVSVGCYDEELFDWLNKKGYPCFSTMKSAEIENNRMLFLDILQELGMPIAETTLCDGLDDLVEFLTGKEDMWLKIPYTRGDFNTKHYTNMIQFKNWLKVFSARIGQRASDVIKVLAQRTIKADCESGWDGFNVNGICTKFGTSGFEEKDKWYIAKVMEEPPDILKNINDKFSPIFKKYGCQGEYHSEVRIEADGTANFTDITLRAGSPNGEMLCEGYSNYAECIKAIAHGEVPIPKPKSKEDGDTDDFIYGAEVILTSDFNEKETLCVQFPKEAASYIKLKNHYKQGDAYYCLPNDNDGFFGAALGFGKSPDEAAKKANEIAEQVICDDLDYTPISIDRMNEFIAGGRKHGINL